MAWSFLEKLWWLGRFEEVIFVEQFRRRENDRRLNECWRRWRQLTREIEQERIH
jgi:hypothetical protein